MSRRARLPDKGRSGMPYGGAWYVTSTFLLGLALAACSSPSEPDADPSGDWISDETFSATTGDTGRLRLSIDPITDPSGISGSFSIGAVVRTIFDGSVSGSDLSLVLSNGPTLTARVESSGELIVGTLSGMTNAFLFDRATYEFDDTPVTLRRGS